MGRYLGREYGIRVLRCQFVTVNHALLLLIEIFWLNCKSNIHSWLSNIGTVNGQVFPAPLKQLGHYVPTTTRQVQFQFSLPISASHWDSFWSPFQVNGIASCNWCRWWSIMRYDSMLYYSVLFYFWRVLGRSFENHVNLQSKDVAVEELTVIQEKCKWMMKYSSAQLKVIEVTTNQEWKMTCSINFVPPSILVFSSEVIYILFYIFRLFQLRVIWILRLCTL